MSRAFVKETSESAPPPERMVEDGPNLVTQAGYEQIAGHVARIEASLKSEANPLLRETLERDLRYWSVKKASAEIVPPPGDGAVAFGSQVTVERAGRRQSFRIVGVDGSRRQPRTSLRAGLSVSVRRWLPPFLARAWAILWRRESRWARSSFSP